MLRPTSRKGEGKGKRVLIAGVTSRAAAESAARAGYDVTAIDAFGDLDQHPSVRALSLPRDFGVRFTAPAAARAARTVECDAVMYVSSFENHPRAVSALAAGRELLGNPPSVLRRARDPLIVTAALRRCGLRAPSVRMTSAIGGRWLQKPLSSGGGRGVRRARRGHPVPGRTYLQAFVDGTPGSIVFLASGGQAVPIGLSRQIVGDAMFGGSGFQYCGSILAPAGDAQFAHDRILFRAACELAAAVADEFGLVGVNGVDFIARDGVPFAIEINPRWSASVELVELAYDLPVFAAHVVACRRGRLPDFDLHGVRRAGRAVGKAVVFARRDLIAEDTRAWLGPSTTNHPPQAAEYRPQATDHSVHDVPQPGERIPAGRPVCTVVATGRNAAECYAALTRRAAWVYAQLAAWERNVA
jgi:predicted ATP-grasp superfamily ATP-dependent carboligase